MTDDYQPPSSAELKAQYIEAADKGKWEHCRMICTTVVHEGLTLEERIQWRKMYELAGDPSGDSDWPKLRAELV